MVVTYVIGLAALQASRKMAAQLMVLQQVEDFLSTLKDAETGQRGYLLTGDESYLEPYTNSLAQLNPELASLRRLGETGDLPKDKVDRVVGLTQEKLAELDQTIRVRREQGAEAAQAIMQNRRGKEVMDQIRDECSRMRTDALAKFAEENQRTQRATLRRTMVFIGTGVLYLGFLGWMFRRLAAEMDLREAAVTEASQQRELFATTLTSIGDALIATDREGKVTFMNPVAEKLTGWSQQEARGVPLEIPFKIVNELTRAVAENPVNKVLETGVVVGLANHTVLIAKNGTETPIDDSAAPIRHSDGRLTGVVLVFRDVTARRAAELTSRRLAAIVENAEDAIIGKALDGTIQTWNRGAERIFGYTAAEVIGKPIQLLLPTDRLDKEKEILERIDRGEPIQHFDTRRICKDGRELDVSLSVSPVRDRSGKIVGTSKILRDISVQKETEKALRESEEALRKSQERLASQAQELEQTVAARTEQLRATIAELEAFCYSLSHDMRAPLRAIQSYSQMVLEENGANLGSDGTEFLKRVISAADRVDRLIQDVLAYTRLSRQEIVLQPVDVGRLIADIVQERPEFQPPKADIQTEGSLPPVLGHGVSLTQCVTNLLDNAVKFVAPNVTPRVRIRAEPIDGQVRLWFLDNGIGIDKEARRRLFEMFQRVHNNAQEYEGTGIGLAIVRKAAERMHGQVGVESESGKGSQFWVQLPKA
jgi:PAS domain S-box-containing protein